MKVKVTKVTAKRQMVTNWKVMAYCSMTGEFEGAFESMEELRKVWPSAEIVCTEDCGDYIKVYC